MIVCAGKNETFSFATPIGVGLIQSSINLARLCLFDKPEYLLFVGSAGSYGKYDILDIVQSVSASNIELSYLQGYSYTPLDNVISIQNSRLSNDTIVNSSNYITTNATIAQEYNSYGIGIENMEFFSVMSIAKEFGIQAGGIFVITNYTNDNAHDDFVSHHNVAMDKLIEYLKDKNIIQ